MTFCSTLIGLNLLTESNFRQGLSTIQPPLGASVLQFLQSRPWADIQQAINDVRAQTAPGNRPLRDDEFDSLRFAAVDGARDSIATARRSAPCLKSVLRMSDGFWDPPRRYRLRIVPISRLRWFLFRRDIGVLTLWAVDLSASPFKVEADIGIQE